MIEQIFISEDHSDIIVDCDGLRFALVEGDNKRKRAERARRIAACFNACNGLSTDDLEKTGLVSAVGNELLRRDAINAELLEALKFMLKVTRAVTIGEYDEELMDIAQSQAKSAIAKATGEQQ